MTVEVESVFFENGVLIVSIRGHFTEVAEHVYRIATSMFVPNWPNKWRLQHLQFIPAQKEHLASSNKFIFRFEDERSS
jgi:hypothetical protein